MGLERIPADSWIQYQGHVDRYAYAAAHLRLGETVNDVACGVGYGREVLGGVVGRWRGYDRPGVGDPRFLRPGDRYVGCDLDDPGWWPDSDADVTICHATLEHVADPWRLAKALAATSRRALVVSTVTRPTSQLNPWHLHDFTATQIPPMFPGFGVVEVWDQPDELCHVWLLERSA
jgi:hypothetical protein